MTRCYIYVVRDTVRTTIRIRKDLLNQSKLHALRQGTSLQETINQTLAAGFGQVSDLNTQEVAMAKIDNLRKSLTNQKINVQKLVEKNKRQLEDHTHELIKNGIRT